MKRGGERGSEIDVYGDAMTWLCWSEQLRAALQVQAWETNCLWLFLFIRTPSALWGPKQHQPFIPSEPIVVFTPGRWIPPTPCDSWPCGSVLAPAPISWEIVHRSPHNAVNKSLLIVHIKNNFTIIVNYNSTSWIKLYFNLKIVIVFCSHFKDFF